MRFGFHHDVESLVVVHHYYICLLGPFHVSMYVLSQSSPSVRICLNECIFPYIFLLDNQWVTKFINKLRRSLINTYQEESNMLMKSFSYKKDFLSPAIRRTQPPYHQGVYVFRQWLTLNSPWKGLKNAGIPSVHMYFVPTQKYPKVFSLFIAKK